MRKVFVLAAVAIALFPSVSCLAQESDFSGWFSVGLEKKIVSGLSLEAEGEYRTCDHFSRTDRWGAGLSLTYRVYRNESKTFDIKTAVGAKYLKSYYPGEITLKDMDHGFQEYNSKPDYNVDKFRATASVAASQKLGRFKISLRERYQYTGNDSVCIIESKWRYDKHTGGLEERETEEDWKARNNRRHSFRSRLQISFDTPSFFIDPYVSAELCNDLKDNFRVQKVRYLFGLDCELAKSHDIKLYYMYQNHADEDEPGGHVIGLSYCFEF